MEIRKMYFMDCHLAGCQYHDADEVFTSWGVETPKKFAKDDLKAILDRLGVQCDFVVGVCTNGGGHAWNLVNIEGDWYQLDITWNDCISGYDFFLVTDDYMKGSRTWNYAVYPATPSIGYREKNGP